MDSIRETESGEQYY